MTIDIIEFTETQYSLLTEEQLLEVKEAQLKKNRLQEKLEEELLKLRNRMVKNGTYCSEVYSCWEIKLYEECEREIEILRESLLFYLRYALRLEEDIASSPYKVDYSLSEDQRLNLVRNYYLQTYADRKALFQAFRADTVAPKYLGELYKPLYDYFQSIA